MITYLQQLKRERILPEWANHLFMIDENCIISEIRPKWNVRKNSWMTNSIGESCILGTNFKRIYSVMQPFMCYEIQKDFIKHKELVVTGVSEHVTLVESYNSNSGRIYALGCVSYIEKHSILYISTEDDKESLECKFGYKEVDVYSLVQLNTFKDDTKLLMFRDLLLRLDSSTIIIDSLSEVTESFIVELEQLAVEFELQNIIVIKNNLL